MAGMMKGGFADEQMIGFLGQAEAGMPNKELRRWKDFSNATFYKWRVKYTELVSCSFII
jgi:putative transposase